MAKSKKQSKGKKKTVQVVKADCDKTLPMTKTEKVKAKNGSSCPEQVSRCAESASCPVCSDKDGCLCAERKSESKSVADQGQAKKRRLRADLCLTSSLVERQSLSKPCASTSSRSRRASIRNFTSEEKAKTLKNVVSALTPSSAFEEVSGIKDDNASCTGVKTEVGKLLIAACKQKLEDESESQNLALRGADQCKKKYTPSVKSCRNFITASGSRIKQTGASESQKETGKVETVPSPKVVICPNDCLNLESMAKRGFQDDSKTKLGSKKCNQIPDAQQEAKSVKADRSSTSRQPIVAKNSSSIASFLVGFTSHSTVEKEKEKGSDLPQSCDSVSICRGIKEVGNVSTYISLSTDVKDDASDVKEQDASDVKEHDASDMKEHDASDVKEHDASVVKEHDASDVKEQDASVVKEQDASVVKEQDANDLKEVVKEHDASAVKEHDASYMKEHDASAVKEHEVLPSASMIENPSITELPQSLPESDIAPVSAPIAITPCKRRHRSDRKSSTKKRSMHTPLKQNVANGSASCKSTVVRTKSVKPVKSESKDGQNQVKPKVSAAKDVAPNVVAADATGAPILTRSMIKTPGSSTALVLPDEVSNSRKRRVEPKEPRQNIRLEQHACLLWSSEQRRRFQQEHPEAKSDELDEIMRNYWRTMSERDCQRYIQRARNALSDRNGGLRTRFRNPPLCHTSTASRRAEYSMAGAQFERKGQTWNSNIDGSAYVLDQRSKVVRTKLKYLQQNLSRFQYQKFINEFQVRLAKSQQNTEDAQNFHTHQWNDGDKIIQQQKFSETALNIMQKLIQDQEKTLKYARYEHMAAKRRRMLQTYEFLVSETVQSTGNCFFGDSESDLLTEILSDLEELEEDHKMPCAANGDPHASDHDHQSDVEEKLKVTALAKSLSSGAFTTGAGGAEEDGLPNVEDLFYQKVLLYEASCQPSLHQLHVDDVEDCFSGSTSSALDESNEKYYMSLLPSDIFLMDALSRVFRQLGGVEPCCDLNCPSCILTDLLIASKLQQVESGSLQLDDRNQNADLQTKLAEDSDANGRIAAAASSQFAFNREFNDACMNSDGGVPVYESEMTSKSRSDHYMVADSELDGIFGVDTWLTAPIVRCPLQAVPAEACAVLESQVACGQLGCPTLLDIGGAGGMQNIRANSCSDLGAWAFQEEQDEAFGFMQVLHDNAETISAAVCGSHE